MKRIRISNDLHCVRVISNDIDSALRVLHGRVFHAGVYKHSRYRRKKTPAWLRRQEKCRQVAKKKQDVSA